MNCSLFRAAEKSSHRTTDIAAIGSGGSYALAAAKALKENTDLSALDIATKAITIAGKICNSPTTR